jgi:tripartite-type tricarboxylate transporter receptor subunit TctC
MPQVDRRTVSLFGLAALLRPQFALAGGSYPSRPIHIIVGFTPGAAADVTGRVLADSLGPIIGQQLGVENKPGAGSSIAAEYVAHAGKDGYTLFLATLSIIVNQIINPNPALDLERDLAPIALLASVPVVLVVNPDSDVHSVADLIALAKSKSGGVLHATVIGSLPHLASELFAQRTGIKWTQVPYQGSPQTVTDVIAGRALATFSPASTVIGQIAAGKLRPLATATHKRSQALPDVPKNKALRISTPVFGSGCSPRPARRGRSLRACRDCTEGAADAESAGSIAQAGVRTAHRRPGRVCRPYSPRNRAVDGRRARRRFAELRLQFPLRELRLERIERFQGVARRHVVGIKRRERVHQSCKRGICLRGRRRPRAGEQRQVVDQAARRRHAVFGFDLRQNDFGALDDA